MDKLISTIYIKQDIANQSLLVNAISQAIVKILYAANESIDFRIIKAELQKIVGSQIEDRRIEDALNELVNNSYVRKSGEKYKIRDAYRDRLKALYDQRRQRLNSVLEEYFSEVDFDKGTLQSWFEDMNTKFFSEYSRNWIEDVIGRSDKNRKYVTTVKTLSDNSINKKYKIKKDLHVWLNTQYTKFLRSNDPEDQLLMWDYANTMFSCQLIAANIYADQSILDIFENSTMVLDTNILMYLDLEKDVYNDAYESLESIFEKLKINPVYFHITKEEYCKAIRNKIDEISRILKKYDIEVLLESTDTFIQTAIGRKCTKKEHFDTFFEEIRKIPSEFNNSLEIKELDYRELSDAIENGQQDTMLKDSLNEIYKRHHNYDKSKQILKHDAGLIAGAKFLRSTGDNTWILTRDGSIHTYSVENVKATTHPIAVNLKTLINLFSVSDGGIDLKPTDFLPLFSSFIRNDVIPEKNTFKIEDLTRMYEIQDQITQLPKDDIVELAKEISRDRIFGIADSRIALKVQRRIQSYKIEVKDELSATQRNYSSAKDEVEKLIDEMQKRKENFVKGRKQDLLSDFRKKNQKSRIITFLSQIFILLFISGGLIFLYDKNNEDANTLIASIVVLIINFLANAVSLKTIYESIFNNKEKQFKLQIGNLIDEEWSKLLD